MNWRDWTFHGMLEGFVCDQCMLLQLSWACSMQLVKFNLLWHVCDQSMLLLQLGWACSMHVKFNLLWQEDSQQLLWLCGGCDSAILHLIPTQLLKIVSKQSFCIVFATVCVTPLFCTWYQAFSDTASQLVKILHSFCDSIFRELCVIFSEGNIISRSFHPEMCFLSLVGHWVNLQNGFVDVHITRNGHIWHWKDLFILLEVNILQVLNWTISEFCFTLKICWRGTKL